VRKGELGAISLTWVLSPQVVKP